MDRHPLPPDGPDVNGHPLSQGGMTRWERLSNLVAVVMLLALGLYTCAVPF